ncbi:hypothetical protein MSPP1_000350 [Malassezia sp. CBS 17886]|nr:hypothetical protein MSPP1_000350 [Malassezia sp. CBS 17886]
MALPQIDGLSLALVAVLAVVLLAIKVHTQRQQPLLHPLILGRQTDASQVHAPGESPTYRNVNAPLGFDLAMRPKRTVPDVHSLLAESAAPRHLRRVLGTLLSNIELAQLAGEFADGARALLGDGDGRAIIVWGGLHSANALAAVLAAAFREDDVPTLIAPSSGTPRSLPAGARIDRSLVVCLDTSLPLPAVFSGSAALVTADDEGAAQLRGAARGSRVVLWSDVVGLSTPQDTLATAPGTASLRTPDLDRAGARTFAWFWEPIVNEWVRTTHTSITSGVTAWLSEFPAELIPGPDDLILSNLHTGVVPTPAYVALALMALYTSAGIAATPTAGVADAVRTLKPTLLYVDRRAAQVVEKALWLPATSSALYSGAVRVNVNVLRGGKLPRGHLLDTLVCAPVRRSAGADGVRGAVVLSNGCDVDQELLDQLRVFLAAPVVNAYIPSVLEGADGARAVATAPVCATHMYDLQAFAVHPMDDEYLRRLPAHVGPPSVSTEIKLVAKTPAADVHADGIARLRDPASGMHTDPIGDVCVRGYSLAQSAAAGTDTESGTVYSGWYSTGDLALQRANGTLVLLAPRGSDALGVMPNATTDPRHSARLVRDMQGQMQAQGGSAAAQGEADGGTGHGGVASGRQEHASSARGGQRKAAALAAGTASLPALLSMLLCLVCCAAGVVEANPVLPALRGTPANLNQSSSTLVRREASVTNSTSAYIALEGMLLSQRASWEQGVAQSAVLEYMYPSWSVFHAVDQGKDVYPRGDAIDPDTIPNRLVTLAFHSVAAQDRSGRLATVITGDEKAGSGASQDSASCGEGVLLGAWVTEGFDNDQLRTDMYWGSAASRQLNYLLSHVPRSTNGVISQRAAADTVQLWSDAFYMGPPFIAQYGLMTNNKGLLLEAYNQVRLSYDALRLPAGPGKGLLGHIMNYGNVARPVWIDQRAWLTGNAWATAGMLRVYAAMTQSTFHDAFDAQRNNLTSWIDDLVTSAYAHGDDDTGLLYNVVNDTSTFLDASGSALMAYSAFRLGSLVPGKRGHIPAAEKAYQTIQVALNSYGTFVNGLQTVNELSTADPGPTSTESLAFFLLLAAARRDYYAGNVTGDNGPVKPPKSAVSDDGKKAASQAAVVRPSVALFGVPFAAALLGTW